mmetsp:Transcript_72958/g.211210  ORF Transcript_72958/g.211210 Transcript_72958/m.211210 type:complete len:359 (-) Transcript_72958:1563-2639(-)
MRIRIAGGQPGLARIRIADDLHALQLDGAVEAGRGSAGPCLQRAVAGGGVAVAAALVTASEVGRGILVTQHMHALSELRHRAAHLRDALGHHAHDQALRFARVHCRVAGVTNPASDRARLPCGHVVARRRHLQVFVGREPSGAHVRLAHRQGPVKVARRVASEYGCLTCSPGVTGGALDGASLAGAEAVAVVRGVLGAGLERVAQGQCALEREAIEGPIGAASEVFRQALIALIAFRCASLEGRLVVAIMHHGVARWEAFRAHDGFAARQRFVQGVPVHVGACDGGEGAIVFAQVQCHADACAVEAGVASDATVFAGADIVAPCAKHVRGVASEELVNGGGAGGVTTLLQSPRSGTLA